MKNQWLLLPLLAMLAAPIMAQNNCQGYYLSAPQGSSLTYEMFNKKGKPTGSRTMAVVSLTTGAGQTTGTFKQTFLDEKGKKQTENDVPFVCDGNKITMDTRSIMNNVPEMAANMEMRVEGQSLEIPLNLSVGQTLPDAEITIEMFSKGSNPTRMGTIKTRIFDRKVVAKEKITTPAGVFECFKITYKMETENQTVITMRFEFTGADWLTLGKGLVRSENYRKGELMSYQVLKEAK
jgi:hypothetical protein